MKFDKILEINKNLIEIKSKNVKFNFELAYKLANNLNITNKIVDNQNEKLSNMLMEIGVFDGYDYVIPDDNVLKEKYQYVYDEDIELSEILELTIDDINKCVFDISTMELIMSMMEK